MAFDFRKWVSDGLEERNAWQDTQVEAVVRMETPMRKQLMEMVKAVSECACESAVTEAKEDDDLDAKGGDLRTDIEKAKKKQKTGVAGMDSGIDPKTGKPWARRKDDQKNEAVTEAEEIDEAQKEVTCPGCGTKHKISTTPTALGDYCSRACKMKEESLEEDGATGAASVELPDAKRKRQLGKIKGKMSKKGVSASPDMKAENLAKPKKKV